MTNGFTARTLALVAGGSYCIIFIAASFANFYMLESLMADPLTTVRQDAIWIRAGILAFMITVVFDVVVAWALYELFKGHPLTLLSTLFRMMHAAMMGVAIHALPVVLTLASADDILQQIDIFNSIWLLGLFLLWYSYCAVGLHLFQSGICQALPACRRCHVYAGYGRAFCVAQLCRIRSCFAVVRRCFGYCGGNVLCDLAAGEGRHSVAHACPWR